MVSIVSGAAVRVVSTAGRTAVQFIVGGIGTFNELCLFLEGGNQLC